MRNWKELVFVVAVFASIVVIAATTLDTVQAKNAFCQNNLRKLHSYIVQYENDNKVLPQVNIRLKPRWKFWFNSIKKYSNNELDFACPSNVKVAHLFEEQNALFTPKQAGAVSYGMNYFFDTFSIMKTPRSPKTFANMKSSPKNIILLGDSNGPYMLPERFWTYEKAFRHEDETANFIFCDGSVIKNVKQSYFGKTLADGKFKTDLSKWR